MKRISFIILLAVITLNGMAQTIGEAFYIYRNDGQFNAFFRDEVQSIEYSYYDADSIKYEEIVTQVVITADSVYKIPLAAIDSVGFIQPETIINHDVFPLTAEHSPYISDADVLNFTMSAATPDALRPKVGNVVVATAECSAFPYGIIARVESITNTDSDYQYTCSQAYYDEVFDQLISYVPAMDGNVSDPAYSFDLRRAAFSATLWNVNWTTTIEGGGTTTTLNVGDRGTATVTVCKTLTTPFYFQLQLQNTMSSSVNFNATSTASINKELQIGKNITAGKITIPYTMGLLWLEPKLSLFGYFEEQGSVQLNYSGHFDRTDKVTFTYTQGKWTFHHTPSTDVNTDIASLNMEGSAEVGLKPQIDFSLNGLQAGFGLSARAGLKEYINFVFDMAKLSDGSLYDAMLDSYCRTTIPWSVTVHANANIFSCYDASQSDEGTATFSHTFAPSNEPQWGEDRYVFPLFGDVEGTRMEDKTKADASASVSRTPLLPVQVGFSLLDTNGNILQTKYDGRIYKSGSLFNDYSCELSGLKFNEKYIIRPSVKIFGYDVLASPSSEIEGGEYFPVTLSDFKVTNSQYKENGFIYDGVTYDYCFEVSITATLDEDAEGIADWGYVYLDPSGNETLISLKDFGNAYTDTRWAYFRNKAKSICTLYGYVKYAESDEIVYDEPHGYPLKDENNENFCPDEKHPHMIDLGLPSGTKWACCNVGASVPEQYGNYYAWGEVQPKDVYSWDTYQYRDEYNHVVNIGSDIAGTSYDVATVKWEEPWRMPSEEQYKELVDKCTSIRTTLNCVKGRRFTGPNGGTIFFPAAGYHADDLLCHDGGIGEYWSSTSRPLDPPIAFGFAFDVYFIPGLMDNDSNIWITPYRFYGLTVRPVH